MEDIDRIEVIRGPGASLWGANAVNGVINIITKPAGDTQGGIVTAGIGTELKSFTGSRYGGHIGDDAYWRVYAKYNNIDIDTDGLSVTMGKSMEAYRTGFRLDWVAATKNHFMFQGNIYNGSIDMDNIEYFPQSPYSKRVQETEDISGGNLIGRWHRDISKNVQTYFQLYYDHTKRDSFLLNEDRHTMDADFQCRMTLHPKHEFIWGLGYRYTKDNIDGTFSLSFKPDSKNDHLYNGFLHYEVSLIPKKLIASIGTKLEYNEYSHFEIQPSVRLRWSPNKRNMFWASVSRAVRTPSRSDEDIIIRPLIAEPFAPENPSPLPIFVEITGSEDFDSEELLAFELGYRKAVSSSLSLDLAGFYNRYENLQSTEGAMPVPEGLPIPSYLAIPQPFGNKLKADTYGVELSAQWRAMNWWKWVASYSFLQIQTELEDDSTDTRSDKLTADGSPHHQVSLRSSMTLPKTVNLDFWFRFVDNIPAQDIDSYATLDIRLSWRPAKAVEIVLAGQNIMDSGHKEFFDHTHFLIPNKIERSFYGKINWWF
jgi:iron complex outermembrane recepter protein